MTSVPLKMLSYSFLSPSLCYCDTRAYVGKDVREERTERAGSATDLSSATDSRFLKAVNPTLRLRY